MNRGLTLLIRPAHLKEEVLKSYEEFHNPGVVSANGKSYSYWLYDRDHTQVRKKERDCHYPSGWHEIGRKFELSEDFGCRCYCNG